MHTQDSPESMLSAPIPLGVGAIAQLAFCATAKRACARVAGDHCERVHSRLSGHCANEHWRESASNIPFEEQQARPWPPRCASVICWCVLQNRVMKCRLLPLDELALPSWAGLLVRSQGTRASVPYEHGTRASVPCSKSSYRRRLSDLQLQLRLLVSYATIALHIFRVAAFGELCNPSFA
jgi:hypothetical protein